MASVLKLFTAQKHRESHELNDNDRTGISQEAQEARGMQQRCAKKNTPDDSPPCGIRMMHVARS